MCHVDTSATCRSYNHKPCPIHNNPHNRHTGAPQSLPVSANLSARPASLTSLGTGLGAQLPVTASLSVQRHGQPYVSSLSRLSPCSPVLDLPRARSSGLSVTSYHTLSHLVTPCHVLSCLPCSASPGNLRPANGPLGARYSPPRWLLGTFSLACWHAVGSVRDPLAVGLAYEGSSWLHSCPVPIIACHDLAAYCRFPLLYHPGHHLSPLVISLTRPPGHRVALYT